MRAKELARAVTPPLLWRAAARLKSALGEPESGPFEGPFPSWQAAESRADGWDSPIITQKTLAAARRVRDDLSPAEQDGVPSERIPYSTTVLSFLALVAARFGRLELIDFGGGLGAGYYQYRKVLRAMGLPVVWNVVERAAMFELGVAEFARAELRFFRTLGDVPEPRRAVMFTSSVQYLPDPHRLLDEVAASAIDVAFDRVLMSPVEEDRPYVQHPNRLVYYDATYPVWSFARRPFIERMAARGFSFVEAFSDDGTAPIDQCGLLFVRSAGQR